jgi:predicted nucleic acid-binding protein
MTIAHQNMFESLRVLTHKKFPNPMSPTNAIAAINSIAERCQVIAPESGTQHFALALMKKHKLTGDKIFDAYLAATVLAIGITTIATDNTKDFLPFEGITVFNPFS